MKDLAEVDSIRSPKLVRSPQVRQCDAILQGDPGKGVLGLNLQTKTLSMGPRRLTPLQTLAAGRGLSALLNLQGSLRESVCFTS